LEKEEKSGPKPDGKKGGKEEGRRLKVREGVARRRVSQKKTCGLFPLCGVVPLPHTPSSRLLKTQNAEDFF
jgi:hypothetical protein